MITNQKEAITKARVRMASWDSGGGFWTTLVAWSVSFAVGFSDKLGFSSSCCPLRSSIDASQLLHHILDTLS